AGFEFDAQGRPKLVDDTINTLAGFSLKLHGNLTFGPLVINGEFKFRLEGAGPNAGLELIVNASMSLAPIGDVELKDSGFRITAAGIVLNLDVSSGLGNQFGKNIGFTMQFDGEATLKLNTTGSPQMLGSTRIDPGFSLHLKVTVDLAGFASADGFVDITLT